MKNRDLLIPLLVLSAVSAFLLPSCTKESKLPQAKFAPKIVLLGELTANDTVGIRGGQSMSIPEVSTTGITNLPQSLAVFISTPQGAEKTLRQWEDDMAQSIGTLLYSDPGIVAHGGEYVVRATNPGMDEVTARVKVPGPFTAIVADTVQRMYGNDSCMRFGIRIQDAPGKHYYVIEALVDYGHVSSAFLHNGQWWNIEMYWPLYDSLQMLGIEPQQRPDTVYMSFRQRREMYTADGNTENAKTSYGNSKVGRVLLADDAFDGQDYRTEIYLPIYGLRADYPGDIKRVLLQIKSISEDYFRFLSAYILIDPIWDQSGSTLIPVSVPSNVQNGLGMIGGVYKVQFSYNIN